MTLARSSVLALLALSALAACERKSEQAPAPEAPAVESGVPSLPAPHASAGRAPTYSPAYQKCMASGDAAKGVTYAMQDCLVEEMKVADERLNTVYQRVMKSLDDSRGESLRQAQRAWIVVRDSTCQANLTGGTIDRLNVPACRLDATIARTKELEAMLPAN